MRTRRLTALGALTLGAAAVVLVVESVVRGFPRGLFTAVLLVLMLAAAWEAIRRRGRARTACAVLAGLLLATTIVVWLSGGALTELIVAIILSALAAEAARRAGKAAAAHLDVEARARGIEPIELRPGDDLLALVNDAVARGADALAAAGGDGTQALVAGIAAEHDLPFACIPAGTRNHSALDLGVDRSDVVGALDAFVHGAERRVDLAEVNGRVVVNNVSLGLYAEAVRPGYRDAKLRMMLDTVPEFAGPTPSGDNELRFASPHDAPKGRAIVVQVSNNDASRIDDGLLGIAVLNATGGGSRLAWRQWTATSFDVDADGPVPVGVDGEALMLDPPLRFTIRPGALRVRIAPKHPGTSPSVAQPTGVADGIRQLVRIARAGEPWSS